jgi:hypothetical protein
MKRMHAWFIFLTNTCMLGSCICRRLPQEFASLIKEKGSEISKLNRQHVRLAGG